MSILSELIGKVAKPIIERRIRREMCSGKKNEGWKTGPEVKDAGNMGGREKSGSARATEAERFHRIPDQPAG